MRFTTCLLRETIALRLSTCMLPLARLFETALGRAAGRGNAAGHAVRPGVRVARRWACVAGLRCVRACPSVRRRCCIAHGIL